MPLRLAGPFAALVLLLATAAPAAADVVVPDDQIVQGNQCVGVLCADGEVFGGPTLQAKSDNTPGLRFVQTGDAGWAPQTWDVAGNEANFFVRDLTHASKLPFRIRPGAPTNSLDISTTGDISTVAMLQQDVTDGNITVIGAADGGAILAALRGLTLSRYRINADTAAAPHVGPTGTAFRAAFATGNDNTRLAAADTAGIALAAVKALDARVSTLALTPGPAGAAGTPADTVRLAAVEAANRKLTRANRRLTTSLASLKKQVKALARR